MMARVRQLPPEPGFEPQGILDKAVSYIRAEASLAWHGPVTDLIFERRANECRNCPSLVKDEADEIGFCGACNCGKAKRAKLTVKLRMPAATCPQKKW